MYEWRVSQRERDTVTSVFLIRKEKYYTASASYLKWDSCIFWLYMDTNKVAKNVILTKRFFYILSLNVIKCYYKLIRATILYLDLHKYDID